jgi:hypothetical protein
VVGVLAAVLTARRGAGIAIVVTAGVTSYWFATLF